MDTRRKKGKKEGKKGKEMDTQKVKKVSDTVSKKGRRENYATNVRIQR